MIPFALVTGFLGSGKTTLLQRIAERSGSRRLIYLVNEFSAADVDGRRVTCPPNDLIRISGGSVFCHCLVTEFMRQLNAVADRATDANPPVQGVVVEASGVADPKVVGRMLRETRLDRTFELCRIVTVIDPGSYLKLIHTLPNIRSQVEAASLALLNKTDLYAAETLGQTENHLRSVNPSLEIIRTERCGAEVDLFVAAAPPAPEGEYARCADPNYARVVVRVEGEIGVGGLIAWLEGMRTELYRAKGFVIADGQWVYLDHSAADTHAEPAGFDAAVSELAVILRGDAQARFHEYLRRFNDQQSNTGARLRVVADGGAEPGPAVRLPSID